MALSLRDSLLSKASSVVSFTVSDFDGTLYARPISGAARDKLEQVFSRIADGETALAVGVRALIVQASLCDESGTLVFGNDEVGLINDTLSARMIDEIVEQAKVVSGLADKADEAVENAVKN